MQYKCLDWYANAVIFLAALKGRHSASAGTPRSPRILYSITLVSIPFFALISTIKLDSLDGATGHR